MVEYQRVAALRLQPLRFVTTGDLSRYMVAKIFPLVQQGVDLVVFPGLLPMGLLSGEWSYQTDFPAYLHEHGQKLREQILEATVRASRVSGLTIVPGSAYFPVGPRHYLHWSCIVSPDGEILGEVGQTHRPQAGGEHLVLAEDLPIWETPIGRVGFLLGDDVLYPEVSRILTLQGAEILIAPRAPIMPYAAEHAMAGLWQNVQQNQVFGVESGLFGSYGDVVFDGRAAVYAPCEITPEESGFLPKPGFYVGDGAQIGDFDFWALKHLQETYPLLQGLNRSLYKRYFPSAYRKGGLPNADR